MLAVLALGLAAVAAGLRAEEPASPPNPAPAADNASGAPIADDKAALFDRLDSNHDGFVNTDEVPSEKQRLLKRLLSTSDADHDGKLSRAELIVGLTSAPPPLTASGPAAERAAAAQEPGIDSEFLFRRMDTSGDGRVTTDEIPEERRENFGRLLERGDTDGDGALSRAEFDRVRELFRRYGGPAAKKPNQTPADNRNPARLWKRLQDGDNDGDGKLSKDELPERLQRAFNRLDANENGFLEESEFQAVVERMREAAGN